MQLAGAGRYGLVLAVALLASGQAGAGQDAPRTLTGTVEDASHEPLRGAVVQLQMENTTNVVSWITDASGHFSFKRLSYSADYQVWATFRGKKSKTVEMSHFDSKPDKAVTLMIRLD